MDTTPKAANAAIPLRAPAGSKRAILGFVATSKSGNDS